MDARQLRHWCLSFPGAEEEFPFRPGLSVFKVYPHTVGAGQRRGKVFALSSLGEAPLSVSLKCEPDLAVQLRTEHAQITGAWHLNKKHWNGVLLEGLEESLVKNLVEDSYDLVVAAMTRQQRESLNWRRLH